MSNKKEKIEAAIIISSYLDTLGYKDAKWEFNYGNRPLTINDALIDNFKLIHHYMALGGHKYIDIENWKSSDDTLLIIATIKALLKGGNEIDFINEYINIFDELNEEHRSAGYITLKSIKHLKKIIQKKKDSYLEMIPYDDDMGGNGAAIRTGPIGIFYHNNIKKLMDVSITCSRLTHNIPLGYLGGFISALFTAYAYSNIEPWLWIDKLLELYESGDIIKYINSTNIKDKHDKEIKKYFMIIYKYREKRLLDLIHFRNKLQFIYPKERLLMLSEFRTEELFNWNLLGGTGLDSIIYSYDSLLMSILPNNKNEICYKNPIYNTDAFIFFTTLHVGDSDSTGCIAGFWYGALLGYNDFDKDKFLKLEFYDELKKLSNKIN
jgi:ADP-ribosylarginine hydrolase